MLRFKALVNLSKTPTFPMNRRNLKDRDLDIPQQFQLFLTKSANVFGGLWTLDSTFEVFAQENSLLYMSYYPYILLPSL